MEMVSFQLQNEFYELNFFHFEGKFQNFSIRI